MKALKAFFILALAAVASCSDPSDESKEPGQILEGWEIASHPHGLNINARDLLFLDAETGFVVGFNGVIFKTIDGGDTWQQKNSGTNLHLYSVSFIDSQTGFMAGHGMNCIDGDCGLGAIFLNSSDGGETWTKRFFPSYIGFDDIHFFDEMNGIAMISTGNQETTGYGIGRTADGGQSWTLTEIPVQMYSQFQIVDDIAFAAGKNQQIFKSVNSGITWTNFPIPIEAWNDIRRLYFYNENIGFVDGVTSLYRTTDGGASWETSELPFGSMNIFHSYDEHESFNMEGVFRYEGGEFPQFKGTISQQTSTGGQAWQVSEISEAVMLGLTVFPQRDLGYGLNGTEFYTIKRK